MSQKSVRVIHNGDGKCNGLCKEGFWHVAILCVQRYIDAVVIPVVAIAVCWPGGSDRPTCRWYCRHIPAGIPCRFQPRLQLRGGRQLLYRWLGRLYGCILSCDPLCISTITTATPKNATLFIFWITKSTECNGYLRKLVISCGGQFYEIMMMTKFFRYQ